MKYFILVLALMSAGSALGVETLELPVTMYGEQVQVKMIAFGDSEKSKFNHARERLDRLNITHEDNFPISALAKKLERMEAKQDCMIAAMNAGAPESVNGCLKNKKVDSKFYVNPNSSGGGGNSGSGANSLAH